MNVTESVLDGGAYEQRYSVRLGIMALPFVRRPVAIAPREGAVCFVDNGPRAGTIPRQCVGTFKDGKWVGAKFEPTHWTAMEGRDGG